MKTKCSFVALIGEPNAGKSTLMNALVGGKVSIVSHKRQTTRQRILGVMTAEETQLVFLDTPGLFDPAHSKKGLFEHTMIQEVWRAVREAEQVLVLIDAAKPIPPRIAELLENLSENSAKNDKSVYIVLNKIDLIDPKTLLAYTEPLKAYPLIKEIFMISALKEKGLETLSKLLLQNAPEGPWLFSPEAMTNLSERLWAQEITREEIFLHLHQEVPYETAVATDLLEELKDGSLKIKQTIYVSRPGQKGIILGKGGTQIKRIGERARHAMEDGLQRRVHLFLFVKVLENWTKDPQRFQQLGYS